MKPDTSSAALAGAEAVARERAIDRDVEQHGACLDQPRLDLERPQRLAREREPVVLLRARHGLDRRHAPALGADAFVCRQPLVEAEGFPRQAPHPLVQRRQPGEDVGGRERDGRGDVLAAGEHGVLVGRKVVIDGADADAGAVRNVGHGGRVDSPLAMQRIGRLDDAAASFFGRLGSAVQSIAPGRHSASHIHRIIFIEYISSNVKRLSAGRFHSPSHCSARRCARAKVGFETNRA